MELEAKSRQFQELMNISIEFHASKKKTPLSILPTNEEAVHDVLTAPRGQDVLLQSRINTDQIEGGFEEENKMSCEALLKLRKVCDSIFQKLHQPNQVEKDLAKIHNLTDETSFWEVGNNYFKSQVQEGRKQFIEALKSEIQIVGYEKLAYSTSMAQVDHNVDAVSVSVARAVENEEHDANEEVARLNREWEEKDRRHKEELEEKKRLHKEAELQHHRAVEEVRREEEGKKATLRHKVTKTKESATALKNNFTKSFEKLKKENAARLALPLAHSHIDEDAYHLVEEAFNIRKPNAYMDEKDKKAVEELEKKFFQQLTLLQPSNQQALVQRALDELYG